MSRAWREVREPEESVAGPEGFQDRLNLAWLALHRKEGKFVPKVEIGRRVGEMLRRDKPFNPSAANKWFNEGSVPDVGTIAALATVLQVDPGWLAFGDASQAPAPMLGLPSDYTTSHEQPE
jgi:transcriptional regulator with XRE-family HTH domain